MSTTKITCIPAALQTVLDEGLEAAGQLPHARRVALYLALSKLCDSRNAARFHTLAAEDVRVESLRLRLQCMLRFPEFFKETSR
jgi:hypothetical protein